MSIKLIPINFKGYELPVFKESRKGDWFEYGSDRPYKNCYGDFLVKLLNESSKQSTIIDAKTKFIVGRGFAVDSTKLTFQERALVEGFLRMPNEDGNMNDLLCKVVKDKKVLLRRNIDPALIEFGPEEKLLEQIKSVRELAQKNPRIIIGTGVISYNADIEKVLMVKKMCLEGF